MPQPSKMDKEYKIRDPIYGFVKLDAQEMDIVNSIYFQRLRRIRQLSLTDMVYPGATHTRFEHSLGVVQMATEMFDNIVADKGNREKLGLEKDVLSRTRKIIRLAALLHDVGHAPFSHAGEDSMPLLPESHPRFKKSEGKRYEHEDYSRAAIKILFRDIIENHQTGEALGIKVEDVSSLLKDDFLLPSRTSVIWSELISGQFDADRADYLLRDSLHLGVNYGIYDRNRLVNCITLGKSDDRSDCFLAVEDGGWHVAESLVIARYQMFSQVYFHPVRRAFDYHVGEATKEVLHSLFKRKDSCFLPPISEKNVKKYMDIDDWTMFDAFKKGRGGEHGEAIIKREPYKCRKEWDTEPDGKEIEKANKAIEENQGFLDKGAETKWYKLDKDIMIYNQKSGKICPLPFKSKLIEVMPGLPKVTRLFISQKGKGADYEYDT